MSLDEFEVDMDQGCFTQAEELELFPTMEEGYRQLRAFIDSIEMPVAFVDESFVIVKLNQKYHQKVDKPFADLVGTSIFSQFPFLNEVPEPFASLFDSSKNEASGNLLDDHGHFCNLSMRKFNDSQGNRLAMVLVHEFHLEDELFQQMLREQGDYLGLLESIDRVLESEKENLFPTAVEQAVKLTDSEIGYLHFYDESSKQVMFNTWSDGHTSMCSNVDNAFLSLPDAGPWMDCIRNNVPVIYNHYADLNEKKGFTNGAMEVHRSLSIPVVYEGKQVAVLGVANRKEPYTDNDARLLKLFSTVMWHTAEMPRLYERILQQSEMLKKQRSQISRSLFDLIGAISETLELKDVYTSGHQKSVSKISVNIGIKLGLSRFELEGLKLGALVHDIGKIGIPSDILSKPSRLSGEEYALIKTHSVLGAEVLGHVKFPWPIKDMVMQHHERLDGSGYPKGLKGEEIIKEARIIAVADVCDSILSHRPYRPSLGLKELKHELLLGRGTKYQEEVVDACFEVLESERALLSNVLGRLSLLPIIKVSGANTLEECRALMTQSRVEYVAVMDEGELVGTVDQHDIDHWLTPFLKAKAARNLEKNILKTPAREIMTRDFLVAPWDCFVEEAIDTMREAEANYLVVISSKGEPTGVLTWRLIVEAKQKDAAHGSGLK